MPEIKHTFTAGKMNKDLDERLVRNGEYRDALNIQIRTTDGASDGLGDAGTVQNLEGNMCIALAYSIKGYDNDKTRTRFIGNVNDESKDKAYFFAAAPVPDGGLVSGVSVDQILAGGEKVWVDSIIEIDTSPLISPQISDEITDTGQAIFVDKFGVTCTWEEAGSPNPEFINPPMGAGWSSMQVSNVDRFRIGMRVYAQRDSGSHMLWSDEEQTIPGVEIVDIVEESLVDGTNGTLFLAVEQNTLLTSEFPNQQCKVMKFVHPERVLEFDHNKLLTGLNIIDDLLFWTDSKQENDTLVGNEPKKISISRSRAGTTAWDKHTKLFVRDKSNNNALTEVTSVENLITSDIKRDHITVIRKKPVSSPTLYLSTKERLGNVEFDLLSYTFNNPNNGNLPLIDQTRVINIPASQNADIQVNDVLTFVTQGDENSPIGFSETKIKVRVIEINEIEGNQFITVKLFFIDQDLLINETGPWKVSIDQKKPLFETKFGRFAYRYKYEDGECSAFSPWSELAFLPGTFLYTPSKGYNVGMVNNVRELVIRDFIPDDSIRPSDVKTVDILWKTTDNANVYVIKSITREINSEWELFTDNDEDNTGSISITSEIIERAIPSNQILRGWDNVPRKAVAQEITANRLVYGNYIQGYDINSAIGLKQSIISDLVFNLQGKKSVKSLRNYKWGMVFGDKYGRETPVISSGYITGAFADGDTVTGDISLPKQLAKYSNKFRLQQTWDDINNEPEAWMDYVKYYIKETSAEYYNLVMDRWYNAEDGNIWLSFPSVDRNKVDEETYLILKNQHGSQVPIDREGRYRVIAIENEAPDYIKTDKRKINPIFMDLLNDVYLSPVTSEATTVPTRLVDKSSIQINDSFYDQANITPEMFSGIKKGRIIAEYQPVVNGTIYKAETSFKTITRFAENTVLNVENRFIDLKDEGWQAEELNMYFKILTQLPSAQAAALTALVTNDVDSNNIDDGNFNQKIHYKFELQDWVVENKPQFDGRFFVKIEADDLVRDSLLNDEAGALESQGVYQLAYIANQASNPGVGNNETWEEAGGGSFGNSNVETQFGVNNNLTENFWNWWWEQGLNGNTSRKSNIFIDNTPIINTDNYADNLVSWPIQTFYTEDGGIDVANFNQLFEEGGNDTSDVLDELQPGINHPSGFLSHGNYQGDTLVNPAGTMTHLSISTLGNSFASGPDSQFYIKMMTNGQLFRFTNDPNGRVYKIKKPVLITPDGYQLGDSPDVGFNLVNAIFGVEDWEDNPNPTIYDFPFNNAAISENYNTDNIFDNLRKRCTIVVRICRLDDDFGDTYDGINVNDWDPRSIVRHTGIADEDGAKGTLGIEFVKKTLESDLLEDEVLTNNACWETEPKKDIDVDIYYEATQAIPMRLDTIGNTQSYTGAANIRERASRVSHEKRVLFDNSIENVALSASAYAAKALGNSTVLIKEYSNETDVDLTPTLTLDDSYASGVKATGIAIGDEINFIHKNGLKTRSKVIDHIKPYQGTFIYTDVQISIPSIRHTGDGLALAWGFTQDLIDQNFSSQIYISADNMYPYVPAIGDEVSGVKNDGTIILERGSFITSVSYAANVWTIIVDKLFHSVKAGLDPIMSAIPGNYTFYNTTGYYRLDENTWSYSIEPNWFNCYSFGNGVESDRIRDDFNAPLIDNGFRASSTFLEYGEEHIGSGLIHSGLYNAVSSVNSLNEFNMAEKITKNLNPIYGSIQALKTRDTNLITFAEDKVLTVLANKDAVFNADGNPQLIATNRVLGTATPFIGDYGISKNPESLASDQYRAYFTDMQRGAVLRLSTDGLTPISSVGMTTFFRERLKICDYLIGTFDGVNGEYNLTLKAKPQYDGVGYTTTISFNEASKGWVSFKSFIPSCGGSISGKYLTAKFDQLAKGGLGVFEHYISSMARNKFYGDFTLSSIDVVFNDMPDVVKSFRALNYEGSQSKVNESYNIEISDTYEDVEGNIIPTDDGEYYNLNQKHGWFVQSFITDMQKGTVSEFINKENKWFNYIHGEEIILAKDIDPSEFSIQGIGFPSSEPFYDTGENSEGDVILQDETDGIDNDIDGDGIEDSIDPDIDGDGVPNEDDVDPDGDESLDDESNNEEEQGDSDTFDDSGNITDSTPWDFVEGFTPQYPMLIYAYLSKYQFTPVNEELGNPSVGLASNGINVFTGDAITTSTDYVVEGDVTTPGGTTLANSANYGYQFICLRVHEGQFVNNQTTYQLFIQGNEISTPYNTSPAANITQQIFITNNNIEYWGDLSPTVFENMDANTAFFYSSLMPASVDQIMLKYGSYTITAIDANGESTSIDINGGYTPS